MYDDSENSFGEGAAFDFVLVRRLGRESAPRASGYRLLEFLFMRLLGDSFVLVVFEMCRFVRS